MKEQKTIQIEIYEVESGRGVCVDVYERPDRDEDAQWYFVDTSLKVYSEDFESSFVKPPFDIERVVCCKQIDTENIQSIHSKIERDESNFSFKVTVYGLQNDGKKSELFKAHLNDAVTKVVRLPEDMDEAVEIIERVRETN